MTTIPDTLVFERILQQVHKARGFDFTPYKRTSLIRCVASRMQVVRAASLEAYSDYLQDHHDEGAAFLDTVLVPVTSFFRDADLWEYVADCLVPELVARSRGRRLRIWSAGCASGQEPYTIAMLFADQLGAKSLRDRVEIHATDLDERALSQARLGRYSARAVADIPGKFLEKYFDRAGSRYSVRSELRSAVVFGRHDLVRDAPIGEVDWLVCRNTVMYFNADTETRLVSRFFASLTPGGCLVLGRPEMLHDDERFATVDLKRRVFRTRVGPKTTGCELGR